MFALSITSARVIEGQHPQSTINAPALIGFYAVFAMWGGDVKCRSWELFCAKTLAMNFLFYLLLFTLIIICSFQVSFDNCYVS